MKYDNIEHFVVRCVDIILVQKSSTISVFKFAQCPGAQIKVLHKLLSTRIGKIFQTSKLNAPCHTCAL